jgi:hypothetical protein
MWPPLSCMELHDFECTQLPVQLQQFGNHVHECSQAGAHRDNTSRHNVHHLCISGVRSHAMVDESSCSYIRPVLASSYSIALREPLIC